MYLIEKFERWAGIMPAFDKSLASWQQYVYFSPLYPWDWSAEERLNTIRAYSTYMQDFNIRYILLYWLFYKWWFEHRIRRLQRGGLPEGNETPGRFKVHDRSGGYTKNAVADAYFMVCQPTLFLLYIVFRRVSKLLEQCLTAPVKVIFSVLKCR